MSDLLAFVVLSIFGGTAFLAVLGFCLWNSRARKTAQINEFGSKRRSTPEIGYSWREARLWDDYPSRTTLDQVRHRQKRVALIFVSVMLLGLAFVSYSGLFNVLEALVLVATLPIVVLYLLESRGGSKRRKEAMGGGKPSI